MLSILVVGWWRAVTGVMRKSRSSIGVAGAVGTLAIGVLLLAGGAAWRVADAHAGIPNGDAPSHGLPETYPRLNTLAPALGLTSQTGEIVTLDVFAGRPILVTFAYAHCVTVCPVIVRQTLAAQRLLAGTPSHPAVVIVTLDPWRDTPSRLPALATAWELPDRDAWVLSGKIEDVERVLTAWNIPRTRDESNGEVTHPSLVYVVQNGRIVFAATGGTETIAELVKRL
jgi:protein SCO1/2